MTNPTRKPLALRALTMLLAVLLASTALAGCKDSDALKEIIFDQSSENIDYDNPNAIYLSDETASVESDRIPSAEVSDSGAVTTERQNLMVYSSEPNTEGYVAKQSLWSDEPDFTGIEASSGVHFVRSDDPTAPEQPLPEEEPEEEPDEPDEEPEEVSGGSQESGDGEGAAPSATSDNKTVDRTGNGASDGGDEEAPEAAADGGTAQGDKSGDEGDGQEPEVKPSTKLPVTKGNVNLDTTDPTEDPLPANKVAAYGDAAVLVRIVGGAGALAAADAELLKTDFTSVAGADVATGWKTGGKLDVDAVIASGADTVLVYESKEISDADLKKLNEASVSVQMIFPNTTPMNIKNNARTIGSILAESEVVEGDPVAQAAAYAAFFDDTIAKTSKAANGSENTVAGTLPDAYRGDYAASGTGLYTLVMDGYSKDATYTNSIGGWTPVSNGAMLATLGTGSSPVFFYVQAGGLINTASVKGAGPGQAIAWQFNTSIASHKKSDWSGLDSDIVFLDGSGYENVLFTASTTATREENAKSNFGSPAFPNVIIGSRQGQEKFLLNSANSNGIYHPYPLNEVGDGSAPDFFGKVSKKGDTVYSTIGVDAASDGENNLFGDEGIDSSHALVCPTGLFCSWIEGTSPEAFLMAAWVNDEVNDDSPKVGWKAMVEEFYQTFYGISADLDAIEKGAEK